MLKVLGIIAIIAVVVIAGFIVYNMIQTHKALNDPRLADNYYENFEAGGTLEGKFAGRGSYEVISISVKSDNKSIKPTSSDFLAFK